MISLIRLRRVMRRPSSRIATACALVVLAGVVAAHHDLPMDMHGMAAGAACLAVLGAGAAALAASATRLFAPSPAAASRRLAVPRSVARRPPVARARAGPLYLRLSVIRC